MAAREPRGVVAAQCVACMLQGRGEAVAFGPEVGDVLAHGGHQEVYFGVTLGGFAAEAPNLEYEVRGLPGDDDGDWVHGAEPPR